MKVRNIGYLCQLPKSDRLKRIAEGLNLLVENIQTISLSFRKLEDQQTIRGYRILRQLAEEESAKFLILIDYVRCPDTRQVEQSRQLRYFYDHFVRSLYAEYCTIRPATWKEVYDWVELMKPSLFLDGPLGVEWIFRNELLQQREQQMYVDFVKTDNENQWIGPQLLEYNGVVTWELGSDVVNLVLAMWKCGFATFNALKEISNQWASLNLELQTHWKEIESINKQTLQRLQELGVMHDKTDRKIVFMIADRWYFPLYQLDLRKKDVDRKALEEIQSNWSPH